MYIKSYSMRRKIYLKTLLFMGLCLWITAGLKAQEPGPGPISPEGEIEDPLAPVRLSTTTCWPRNSESLGATMRAVMSVPPPGEKGEMKRTGLDG